MHARRAALGIARLPRRHVDAAPELSVFPENQMFVKALSCHSLLTEGSPAEIWLRQPTRVPMPPTLLEHRRQTATAPGQGASF